MHLPLGLTIIPESVPETNEDICQAVAAYCAEHNSTYEFLSRDYPVIAVIDGQKYEVTKEYTHIYLSNLWVLRCKKID